MVSRRSVTMGMAGALAALLAGGAGLPASGSALAAAAVRKPPRLRKGDTVGLVCPAGFIADRFGLEQVEETIRAMGLVPKPAPHMLARHGYLAGTDEQRASDLQAMFADGDVRAIFAVRGGWGSQRLLPLLDFDAIAASPKLLVGSSDITALLLALIGRARIGGIHGPNAAHSWPRGVWQDFRGLAFDAAMPTYTVEGSSGARLARRGGRVRTFGAGTARGRLLGGNLSVLSAMAGTPYLPDFDGAILFLEDTNESEYRIDRMLTQLAQSGILGSVAGVVFGQCTNCRNPGSPYGNFTIYEVLSHHLERLGIPAFQGAQFGHISDTICLPVGTMAQIDADAGTIRLLEPAVA